jgi:hypothetical protein
MLGVVGADCAFAPATPPLLKAGTAASADP